MKEQLTVLDSQKPVAFLVGRCADNLELIAALSKFDVRILADPKPGAFDCQSDNKQERLIVMRDFDAERDLFSRVRTSGVRVVSERLVLCNFDIVERRLNTAVLFDGPRPVYNHAMRHCVVCFSGSFEPTMIRRLADIVHFQRGSIRKDVVSRRNVTHLIAVSPSGDKYRYAVSLGIPVMTVDWLGALWSLKDDSDLAAGRTSPKWRDLLDRHRMRPFYALRILLFGFDDNSSKRDRMRAETLTHSGFVVRHIQPADTKAKSDGDGEAEGDDETLFITHVVVNEARFPTISVLDSDRRGALIRSVLGASENSSVKDGAAASTNQNVDVPAQERALFTELLNAIESARRHNESRLRSFECDTDDLSKKQEEAKMELQSDARVSVANANRNVARCSAFTLRVVRSDWFWKSLQIDACVDENAHRFSYGDASDREADADTDADDTEKQPTATTATPASAGATVSRTESRFDRLTKLLGRASIRRPVEHDLSSVSILDATRDSVSSFSTLRSATVVRSTDSNIEQPKAAVRKSNESVDSSMRKSIGRPTERKSEAADSAATAKKLRERTDKLYELLYTETNYVEILDIISRRLPAELSNPEQQGGPTLCAADARRLFSRFEPVYTLHAAFKEELERLLDVQVPGDRRAGGARKDVSNACVGDCVRRRCDEFEKAYSRIINDFEHVRDEVQRTAAENGRFYAFLELLRKRPDCGRQQLADLLIRPVQRLPSLALILAKMLECTPRSHADFVPLRDALDALQFALARINENKRTDEKHKELFSIVKQIKNCPATLLSSHRYVVSKATLLELAAVRRGYTPLVGAFEPIIMLLFNDVIEFCKPRTKPKTGKTLRGYESAANLTLNQTVLGQSTASNANSGALEQTALNHSNTLKRKASDREVTTASYKHVKVITLAAVRGVIDIVDAGVDDDDSLNGGANDTLNATLNSTRTSKRERRDRDVASKRLFGIVYDAERNEQLLSGTGGRRVQSTAHAGVTSEQLVAFTLIDSGDATKREFLETLCHQIIAVNDDLDVRADSLLTRQDAAFLHVDTEFDRDRDRSRATGTLSALRRGTRLVSNAFYGFKKDARTSLASDGRSTPTQPPAPVRANQQHTVTGYYGPSSRTLFAAASVSPSAASTCSLNQQLPDTDADTDADALTSSPTPAKFGTMSLRRITHAQSSGNLLSPPGPLTILPTNADARSIARASGRFGSLASLGTIASSTIAAPANVDSCLSPPSATVSLSLFSPSISSMENDDTCTYQSTRTPDSVSESSSSLASASKNRKKGLKLFGGLFRMSSIRRQKVEAIREERAGDFDQS